jgi:myo-inositol-1(or 4)-monophosphatase
MDQQRLIEAAWAAADAAAAIVRPFFRTGLRPQDKPDESPVTAADQAAERAIRAALEARFPAIPVLGEEFGGQLPDSGPCWVVDPIDGTRAFLTGRPSFCTLIALLQDGIPVLGLIDQPITSERWLGAEGRPTTYLGALGGRIGGRLDLELAEAELSATSPDQFGGDLAATFARLRGATRRTYFGGDAYCYGLVALGQIDIAVDAGMKPWDWAALVPVVQGAGGAISDFSGRALRAGGDGTVIAAGTRDLHLAALDALRG